MVYASSDLRHEHDGILHGLKILESMVVLLKNDEKMDANDFLSMVDFLKLFADKCHHGKEENLLFPALEKAGVQNQNGPIGQMLIEHTQGRIFIVQMSDALENRAVDKAGFAAAATDYINLLRAHINKENNVLFAMADQKITANEQQRLLTAFEKFEETVMGKGTHEKLHETLHRLDEKYRKVDQLPSN